MPEYPKIYTQKYEILLWKYENSDILTEDLLELENTQKIKNVSNNKKWEILMIRKLLKKHLPHHKILYDEKKPILSPKNYEISISHSFPFAILAFSESKIGVDIEKIRSKIITLKHKFINQKEESYITENEILYLNIIWTIKESLYKIHPSKLWSFKEHYFVEAFDLKNLSQPIKCYVKNNENFDYFLSEIKIIEDHILCIVY